MKDKQLLKGIRVLDLSRILAGPWATQLLADYGAEVIKIERPNYGDETRKWGPPWNSDKNNKRSDAAYFYAANRNKQSLTCDISKPQGQTIIKELASKSDVLVENFKSGTLNKYGLNIEELRKIKSDIIYCSITAYGNKSSKKTEPGYDAMIQASAGLMSITGEKQGNPQKVGVAISDIMAGMYAATAILGSLFQRLETGVIQDINVPLFDSQVAWLANQNMNFLIGGKVPERMGNAHPNIAPYQSYNTKDGEIMIAIGSDKQFSKFIKFIQCESSSNIKNFKTNNQRIDNIDKSRKLLGWADGIMVGREAYKSPLFINSLNNILLKSEKDLSILRINIINKIIKYINDSYRNDVNFKMHYITRHMLGLYYGVPGGKVFRNKLNH